MLSEETKYERTNEEGDKMFVSIGDLFINPSNVTFVRMETDTWSGERATLHFASGEFIKLDSEWTLLSVMSILEKEFE